MKTGDIVRSNRDGIGAIEFIRIGDIVINDRGQTIVYKHSTHNNIYYGNTGIENCFNDGFSNDIKALIRQEKLEQLETPFEWVRVRETNSNGAFKNWKLTKKYK